MDVDAPEIRRPDQLYALDSVSIPDFVGDGFGDAYRKQIFVFTFRIWEYLWEHDVDVSQYSTAGELDDDHGDAFQEMLDDVGGASMNQFAAAAGQAMHIQEVGLPEFLDQDRNMILWKPTRTFEWTEREKIQGFTASWSDEDTLEFYEEILEDKPDDQIADDDELYAIRQEVEELKMNMDRERSESESDGS